MVTKREIELADGRRLVAYEAPRTDDSALLTVLWHHGSPQTGVLLDPLLTAAEARRIHLVSYARPSYGGSSPNVGRDVASAARDVEQIVDTLGIGRFAVMGASGGGPHALACAALLPDRVIGAATFASPAPFSDTDDWYRGMVAPDGLRAATAGRAARARYAVTEEFDPDSFTAADWAALNGPWASLGRDANVAGSAGPDGLIDDDVAFTMAWGFGLDVIRSPVLIAQGGADRVIPASHAHALLGSIPSAELWLRPKDGHVSVLEACPVAMDWLLDKTGSR
jgi:pimeloyl-ACP methyl ester carboxylesterase